MQDEKMLYSHKCHKTYLCWKYLSCEILSHVVHKEIKFAIKGLYYLCMIKISFDMFLSFSCFSPLQYFSPLQIQTRIKGLFILLVMV